MKVNICKIAEELELVDKLTDLSEFYRKECDAFLDKSYKLRINLDKKITKFILKNFEAKWFISKNYDKIFLCKKSFKYDFDFLKKVINRNSYGNLWYYKNIIFNYNDYSILFNNAQDLLVILKIINGTLTVKSKIKLQNIIKKEIKKLQNISLKLKEA